MNSNSDEQRETEANRNAEKPNQQPSVNEKNEDNDEAEEQQQKESGEAFPLPVHENMGKKNAYNCTHDKTQQCPWSDNLKEKEFDD
uniref:Uncharacterized protein n=1 Tax=Globodera rostochiensis TaxID=31243 RepID=A0A914HVT2_GLORO